MNPLDEIMKLNDGEKWIWPESDYGKAEIWFKHGGYFLFEIPMYGGEPRFVGCFSKRRLAELIDIVSSWT